MTRGKLAACGRDVLPARAAYEGRQTCFRQNFLKGQYAIR
jgi:hypothetical protein